MATKRSMELWILKEKKDVSGKMDEIRIKYRVWLIVMYRHRFLHCDK